VEIDRRDEVGHVAVAAHSGNFGVILGLRDTYETQDELFYSFQRTELQGGGMFGGVPLPTSVQRTEPNSVDGGHYYLFGSSFEAGVGPP